MRANCDYPGDWRGQVERIEHIEHIETTIITVTRIWTKDMSFHVTSFFEIKGEKIKRLDEYWGDDGEAPRWRKDKHIGKSIR